MIVASYNLPYEQVGNNEPVCIADEVPFDIPDSWEWMRVRFATTLFNGKAFKPSDWSESGQPIVRIQNLNDYNAPFNYYAGDVDSAHQLLGDELLFAWSGTPGTSFGAHIWDRGKAVLNQHIFKLKFDEKSIYKEYYKYALNQRVGMLILAAHGSAGLQHVTKGVFESTLIPLPPYNEQVRIVDKLNKIFPLVEGYDEKYRVAEQINDNFPEQLKKSILQWAVQGKLVPHDPNDEPASVLLDRIREEKTQLIKEGKIKKDKNESIIYRRDNSHYEKLNGEEHCIDDEIPFKIPDSWVWTRLGTISTYASTKKKIKAIDAPRDIWGLDLEDIEKGGRLLFKRKVGERKATGDKILFEEGDILYSKLRPYLLKILIADEDGICTPEIVPFKVFGNIKPEYIVSYLQSPYVDEIINSVTYGVKMPRVGTNTMIHFLVPIPPIKEQEKIVTMIDEINTTIKEL